MRTTINLGVRAHQIAKRFAVAHQISLGEAITRLIEGDTAEAAPTLNEGPGGLLLVANTGHRFGVKEVRAEWTNG